MKNVTENIITQLFEQRFDEDIKQMDELPQSGSDRRYYRIFGDKNTVIGTVNHDLKENNAFISFSNHFAKLGLPVPNILAVNKDGNAYLQSDLGDETLFSFITKNRKNGEFTPEIIEIYKKVIDKLPAFQIKASSGLDYSVCYPRGSFDKQSMMWDLNYFKYYFLKLAQISLDEQALEDDFQIFTDFLLEADCNYFMYRDFQSRNIMLVDQTPYFIDYQGGRRGALQYDLASLLYDGKADIPQKTRNELYDHYIETVKKFVNVNETKFKQHYNGYVLIRIMQAMGAYGFRGFYEKKQHFLNSIPYALKNIKFILENINLPVKLPNLLKTLDSLTKSEKLRELEFEINKPTLTVNICSFSYKKGLPTDHSGNGGGFIFDCRAITNPGKFEQFKHLTGKDKPVKDFLDNEPEMTIFLNLTSTLVENSIEKYIKRSFGNLMVCYGCTGGQHRSVYAAEQLAEKLKTKYQNIEIKIIHHEQD